MSEQSSDTLFLHCIFLSVQLFWTTSEQPARLMLRSLLAIIYKYWWSDNIFHLVADIAFKNKHKAQKTHLMQFFYQGKACLCLMGTDPCWMQGWATELQGKDLPQEPCVWRSATRGHVSSYPSGSTHECPLGMTDFTFTVGGVTITPWNLQSLEKFRAYRFWASRCQQRFSFLQAV